MQYLGDPADADNSARLGIVPSVLGMGGDSLRDEGRWPTQALSAAGVPVRRHCYSGLTPGFLWMSGVSQACLTAPSDIGDRLRAVLEEG